MPQSIPVFQLTQGQVAWTLSLGQAPSKQTVDQLRYLRHLGVPFPKVSLGEGRGHHVRYGYDQLIECGVALYAIRRGMVPREVASYLTSARRKFRRYYREAFLEQPDAALTAPWVKTRGNTGAIP